MASHEGVFARITAFFLSHAGLKKLAYLHVYAGEVLDDAFHDGAYVSGLDCVEPVARFDTFANHLRYVLTSRFDELVYEQFGRLSK